MSPAVWGLYVHIPYCARICPYCEFNVVVVQRPPWAALAAALVAELRAMRPLYAGAACSLYFGGGTPSLAPIEFIAELIAAARQLAGLPATAEITLEANPDGLSAAHLQALRAAGVNRLSLGWQSTDDAQLKQLGRTHTSAAAAAAFAAAREAGFDNLSLDLIFALPGQTLAQLQADIEAVERQAPEHVSLYALTYHPGTPLARQRARGRITAASEDLEAEMMSAITARLQVAGYEHYEVSNYARPGRRAVHNALYWDGTPTLGIGPGAVSFWRPDWQAGWRWCGVRRPSVSLDIWSGQQRGGLPAPEELRVAWVEALSARQLYQERMMCGMRLAAGVDVGVAPCSGFLAEVEAGYRLSAARGWTERRGDRLQPTPLGRMFADPLAAMFF